MTELDEGNIQPPAQPPDDVAQAVVRWVESGPKTKRTHLDRHRDWPAVVRWARDFPSDVPELRVLQEQVVRLDDVLGRSPKAVAVLGFWIFRIKILFEDDGASAPGEGFLRFGRFMLGEKRAQNMLAPIFADMHEEYFAAQAAGKRWHARMALLRGYWLALRPFAEPLLSAIRTIMRILGP